MKWVLPLVVLVGCWNDTPGLRLEIKAAETGATRVELYLATRTCAGCNNRLRPQGVPVKLGGEVWLLDGDTKTKTPNTVLDVTGGKVVFDLQVPDAVDTDVAYIVAVGYGGDGKVVGVAALHDVTIPSDHAEVYRIDLANAANQASSDKAAPSGDRVWVWRRNDPTTAALAACVGIEHSDGTAVERKWFVPEDDTDCDGIDLECDRYNYQAMGTSDVDNASCVVSAKVPMINDTSCLLGGQTCIDGHTDMSCGPVVPSYCLPDALCANSGCRADLATCIGQGVLTYLKITVPTTTQRDRCIAVPDQTAALVDLAGLFIGPGASTPMTKCTGIKFADLQVGMLNVEGDFKPGNAVFKANLQTGTCKFLMSWVSGALPSATNFGVIDLELDNGMHMELPLRVEGVDGACDAGLDRPTVSLHPIANDAISNCALVPKQP